MQGRGHSEQKGKAARQPRAWWQWLLGLGLIGAAVVVGLVSYVPGFQFSRAGPRTAVPPREIVVAADLRPADAVPAEPGEYAGANLLVVTFDTTRTDRLGCYGNDEIKTPSVDRLAREGVLFSNAAAPAPTTLPSHASVLTGLYPFNHGARANGLYRLGESNVTLAEVLSDEGYLTGAVVSAFVLDSQFGTSQGFRDFDDEVGEEDLGTFEIPERPADETTKQAEAWLRANAGEKFFLWVHYYDPHFPYVAPSPFRDQYDVPYDAEIAFADFEFGRLLSVLDELELTDNTFVVFAGDHGEGLGQHNEEAHACLIYESTMSVPLIMRCGERLGGGVHIDREVSLVDIVPTVLAALGVDAPEGLDGIDLTQPAAGSRPIFMETLQGLADHGWAALLGVREGGMKYIYGPESELYELTRDPFEESDQLARRPQVAAALKRRLEAFYGDDLEQAASAGEAQTLSSDAIAKLEALGYLRGSGNGGAPASARPHPKDMIPLMAEVQRAMALEKEQSLEAMIVRLEEILEEHPDLYHARHVLGKAYFRAGEYDLAEQEFVECLNMRPDHAKPVMSLARLKSSQGEIDEARTLYRQVVEEHPDHIVAVNEFGMWLLQRGEYGEAIELLKQALRQEPRDPHLPDVLTDALGSLGRQAEAQALFEEMLEQEPNLPMVRNALARILAAEGHTGEAVVLLKEGIEQSPNELGLVNNLAFLMATAEEEEFHKPVEAVIMLEAVCEKTGYADPKYLHTLAMVYASLYRVDEAVTVSERALKLATESDDPADQELAPSIGQNLEHYRMLKEQGVSPRLLGMRQRHDRRAAMQELFGPAPSGPAPQPEDESAEDETTGGEE
jgi:arylsulfatase A-like enzyme/Tfp pilus assembly protein PilF